MWASSCLLFVALVATSVATGEGGTRTESFSASDAYVNFGAVLVEFAVATRHSSGQHVDWKPPLELEEELIVERTKIKFGERLRESFRKQYPGLVDPSRSIEEEKRALPFFVAPDVAKILRSEGYDTLLNDAEAEALEASSSEGRRRRRQLFTFPIYCDEATGKCETRYDCWGLSIAIDGLNMEETCHLLEKIQAIGGASWTINDWLREIPSYIDALKELDGVAIFPLDNCGDTAKSFSEYSKFGSDAVFHYPKAMCLARETFRGCLYELAFIMTFAVSDPLKGLLPDSVVDVVDEIRKLTMQIHIDLPRICFQLNKIDLLGSGSVISYLENWESLFEPSEPGADGDEQTTKLEVLIEVLSMVTSWDFLKEYLPEIPVNCAATLSAAAHKVFVGIFQEEASMEDLPKTFCAALGSTAVQDCIIGLASNIDKIGWLSSALGNGNLVMLGEEVIPSLCTAVHDMEGLSVDAILAEIPMLLRVYQALGLDVLSSLLPGVHDALVECGDQYADLVESSTAALEDPKALLRLMCSSKVVGNACMVTLSDGLDKFSFARDAIGEGTVKTLVDTTLPEMCKITNQILPEDDSAIDINSVVLLLPSIVDWYASISDLEAFAPYVPGFPREACPQAVVEEMSHDLSAGVQQRNKLPETMCRALGGETQQARTCLLAFGASFETTELMRSLFSSSVAGAGPNATFHALLDDVVPALCKAVSSAGAIDTGDLVRAIPSILTAYAVLDLKPLQQAFPEVHDVLHDTTCNKQFQKLTDWISEIVDGTDTDTVDKVCKRIGRNRCLIDLSQAVDKVSFVQDAIGQGTLELVVESIVPEVCSSMVSVAKELSVETVLERLPQVLDLVDMLVARPGQDGSVFPLASFLPRIPRDIKCREAFHDMALTIKDFIYEQNSGFGTLIDALCVTWPPKEYYVCLSQLGAALDDVELIVDLIGSKGLLQAVAELLIPSACDLLDPEVSIATWTSESGTPRGVFENLPAIVEWYSSLQPNLPSFVQGYLPVFPSEVCTEQTIKALADNINLALGDPGKILSVVCGKISLTEKQCVMQLGDSLDQVPALTQVIGIPPGFLQQVVGQDLEQACAIVGDEFEHIEVSNLVLKIPEILRFVTSLKATMPEFLAMYLPVIPHEECDTAYEKLAADFAELHGQYNLIPGVVCQLEVETAECVSKLGDSLDKVDLIRDLLGDRGLVRYVMETILGVACKAMDNVSSMQLDKLAEQIPQVLHIINELNSYKILDPLVPDVPKTCEDEVPVVTAALAQVLVTEKDVEEQVAKVLCRVSDDAKTCLAELGRSLSAVSWMVSMVPNTEQIALDLLQLLPAVCSLLMGGGTSSLGNPETLLPYLPVMLSLFDNMRSVSFVQPLIPDVSDRCMAYFRDMGNEVAGAGFEAMPGLVCVMNETDHAACFRKLGQDLEAIQAYGSVIPKGLIGSLVDTLPTACQLTSRLGAFRLDQIVASVPDLLDLVVELNKVKAIEAFVPDISKTCQNTFSTSLAPRFHTGQMIKSVCGFTAAERLCVKELVDELLAIPALAGLLASALQTSAEVSVAVGSVVDEVFEALPTACRVAAQLEDVDVVAMADHLLMTLPHLLDVLESLRAFPAFESLIPAIDASCAGNYRTIVEAAGNGSAPLTAFELPGALCDAILVSYVDTLPACLVRLGKSLDDTILFDGVEAMLVVLTASVLPQTCEVIEVVVTATGEIDLMQVIASIPRVADIYATLQQSSTLTRTLLPAFPAGACPSGVMSSIATMVESVVAGVETDIPQLLCVDLSREEKECLASIGDVLDQVSFVREMLGRKGLLRELVGAPLGAVCSALSFESDFGIETLLQHVHLVFDVIEVAHRVAPGIVKDFLPVLPGAECQSVSYPRISVMFAEAFSPSSLCRLDEADAECLALLGDEIDKTPVLRKLIYKDEELGAVSLLRKLVEALPRTLCAGLDSQGNLDPRKIVNNLPLIFGVIQELSTYPVLRGFVPVIPDACLLETLVANVMDDPVGALCSVSATQLECIHGLGKGLEDTGLVPDGYELMTQTTALFPTVCAVLGSSAIDLDAILSELPRVMRLFELIDPLAVKVGFYSASQSVRPSCHERLQRLVEQVVRDVDALPATLCGCEHEDFLCLGEMAGTVEALPIVSETLPIGLVVNVLGVVEQQACPVMVGAEKLDYVGFVTAIPTLIEILGQLEKISVLEPYLPQNISTRCREVFAEDITESLEDGFRFVEEHGLVHFSGDGLEFAGLTSILCGLEAHEEECFVEFAHEIVRVPFLASLVNGALPADAGSLDAIVDTAFEVREHACLLFGELGRMRFESVFYSVRAIVQILQDLNRLPIINAYVPEIDERCVSAVENITDYATGPSPVRDVCGSSADERNCLVELAGKLDDISEVRMIYIMVSHSTTSIQATITTLVHGVLEDACLLMSDIGLGMEGLNLGRMVSKIPAFLKTLETLATMPFIGDLAPRISDACVAELSDFSVLAGKAQTETHGVRLVCQSSAAVRGCVQELNDSFEKVDFIAKHIPKGIVSAFLESLDLGCPVLLQDSGLNRTHFLAHDLPVLIGKVGVVAGVDPHCAHEIKTVCGASEVCVREYVWKISALPLVGKFVPTWTSDVLVDLCAVKSGDQTLETFISAHLPKVLADLCHENEDTMADLLKNPVAFCSTTCASRLPKALVPEGLVELFEGACGFLQAEDATVFSLLPFLAPLLKALSSVLGSPSDRCGNELAVAVGDTFEADVFCERLSQQCITEVVLTLRFLPWIGNALPDGTDQLIGASCAVVNDRTSYSALMEHIPTLFDIVGRILAGDHMDLSDTCRAQVKSELFDRAGHFRPRYLCVIESTCTHELIKALQQLPIVGPYVPDSVTALLEDTCDIQAKVQADGYLALEDDDGMPEIFVLLGKIVPNDHHCGDRLTEFGLLRTIQVSSLCAKVPGECLVLVEDHLKTLPLINAFIPPRTGELLATSCDLVNATATEAVAERLPSLLAVGASFLGLEASCADALHEIGAVFKSKGGAIDGQALCKAMPDAGCLNQIATGLASLPFVGDFVLEEIPKLIQGTCDLVHRKGRTAYQYLDENGPVLLQIASMATSDATCAAYLKEHVHDLVSVASVCTRPSCVEQLAHGLLSMPLVGAFLPEELPALLETACDKPQSVWSLLPTLLYVVGMSSTGSQDCAFQLQRVGQLVRRDGTGAIPSAVCRVEDTCLNLLVQGLENLPFWGEQLGELFPQKGVLRDSCVDDGASFWPRLAVGVAAPADPKCQDPTAAFCDSKDCASEVLENLRGQPLVASLVPSDALVQEVCAVVTLSGEEELLPEIFKPGGFLDHVVLLLPEVVASWGFLEDDALCVDRIQNASRTSFAGTPGSWKRSLSCDVGSECMQRVVHSVKGGLGEIVGPELIDVVASVLAEQPCDPVGDADDAGYEGSTVAVVSGTVLGVAVLATIALFACKAHNHKWKKNKADNDVLAETVSRAIVPHANAAGADAADTDGEDDEEDVFDNICQPHNAALTFH